MDVEKALVARLDRLRKALGIAGVAAILAALFFVPFLVTIFQGDPLHGPPQARLGDRRDAGDAPPLFRDPS